MILLVLRSRSSISVIGMVAETFFGLDCGERARLHSETGVPQGNAMTPDVSSGPWHPNFRCTVATRYCSSSSR